MTKYEFLLTPMWRQFCPFAGSDILNRLIGHRKLTFILLTVISQSSSINIVLTLFWPGIPIDEAGLIDCCFEGLGPEINRLTKYSANEC